MEACRWVTLEAELIKFEDLLAYSAFRKFDPEQTQTTGADANVLESEFILRGAFYSFQRLILRQGGIPGATAVIWCRAGQQRVFSGEWQISSSRLGRLYSIGYGS
ncbi:hypothetical protein PM082_004350 [Marasmius tenuissimus]|nr:hypothetical protein PM082_004350 [Marasmius tenuissimus]